MRLRLLLPMLVMLAPAWTAPAAPWPDFQHEGHGLQPQQGRVGALGFHIKLQGWPRLAKTAVPYYADGISQGHSPSMATLDFGAVVGGGAPRGTPGVESQWACCTLNISDSMKLYASRLTPAVVIEWQGEHLSLFAGEKAPRPAFFATPDGVFKPDGLDRLSLGDGDWLLVWFGSGGGLRSTRFPYCYDGRGWMPGPTAAVDCPLLLVFSQPPTGVALSPAGIQLSQHGSTDTSTRLAILPLRGDCYPPVRETEVWAGGLPEAVQKQCGWWAEHLAEVPLSAAEHSVYDPQLDTITLTTRVEFLKLRDGGVRLAPLPPMLALAKEQGFPLELSGHPVPTGVLTAFGPYTGIEGVEQYTWKVSGLGKYVLQTRTMGGAGPVPERLEKMLRQEVGKIIDAGHLAPWYPAVNVYGAGYRTYLFLAGMLAWGNPGENLFLLGETLPLVDQPSQVRLLAHLKRERANYPPEKTALLRVEEGARRERWRIESAEIEDILLEHNQLIAKSNFYATNQLIPAENVYYLAEHARHVGSDETAKAWPEIRTVLYPYLARQDWATLGWYRWPGRNTTFDGLGGVVDASHCFAAMVGALRLARAAGDAEGEAILWGQFARAAILRYALGKYGHYLHDNRLTVLPTEANLTPEQYLDYCGEIISHKKVQSVYGKPDWMARWFSGGWSGRLVTYDWTGPADDVRGVLRMDEFGVVFDEVLVQYLGKGLFAYRGLVPELGRFLADHQRAEARQFCDRVAEHMPDWHLALATANIGAEHNYLAPEISYQCFLARAWILEQPPGSLARYLDVPWMARGDLYYLHKLTETIRAYQGIRWK